MTVRIGTSGYAYKPWKGKFYPDDLPEDQMLRYYAGQFGTVEINNTFYRMPTGKIIEAWRDQVPDGFSFVLKASRRITHMGRLKNVEDPVKFLFEQADKLGPKLGPLLFQLPPNFKQNLERLRGFLELLPEGKRVAMEFRHISWFEDPVYEALRSRNVALCFSDGEMKEEPPFVATADWGYLRLRDLEYTDEQLEEWRDRIQGQAWNAAYVFFKHEDEATGPALAERFGKLFPQTSKKE